MNCSNCGAAVPSGAMFCTNCGADVSRSVPVQQPRQPRVPYPGTGGERCPSCGTPIERGSSFCTNCGASVGGVRTTMPTSVCWSCGAAVPGSTRFCPSCGVDQDDIPRPVDTRGSSRGSSRGNGPLIALICVLVAIIAALSVAFATGALDGLFHSKDKDDDEAAAPEPTVTVVTAAPETTPPAVPDTGADYIFPDSSTRALTNADLAGLTHQQLGIARNEIFARHGYIFQEGGYRAYFLSKTWYTPTTSNPVLSALETQNVELIRNYENAHFGGVYHWYS